MICPRTSQAFLGSVDLLDGKVQVLAASKKHPSKRGGARSGVQPRRNLSTTLRQRRFRFTEQAVVSWSRPAG